MLTIDKLAWIEIQDKKILSTRSYGKDKYYIPGGKREAGETDAEALVREIREELTVALAPETLALVGIFEAQAHGHPPGTLVKMTCYTSAYTGTLAPAAEIEDLMWLTYADMDKISHVDILIFNYLKERDLIE